MTSQDERRRSLGIPVHESEKDHSWRSDGYCNCGASKPKITRSRKLPSVSSRTMGKSNLDYIERNSEANF